MCYLSRAMYQKNMAMLDALPIGDLVICIPVVLQEAIDQDKTPIEHFTHMLVHGTSPDGL